MKIGRFLAVWSIVAPLAACAAPATHPGAGTTISVVAAENFWGSIAAQVGGAKVTLTNIIDSPNADPHDYEPTPANARAVASADLVIVNGVGYDTWAKKLVDANPSTRRLLVNVGDLAGVKSGDNPHRWYNPDDVERFIAQLVTDFKRLDPGDASAFDAQQATFETTGLADYKAVISEIRSKYAGVPIGASESIVSMIAPALGLDLVTPSGFLKAISEGTDPSAADKATIDGQITSKAIKLYVYNSQNATPDVQAQVDEATAHGIAVTTITETMTPATTTFQQWQTTQLRAIRDALAAAAEK